MKKGKRVVPWRSLLLLPPFLLLFYAIVVVMQLCSYCTFLFLFSYKVYPTFKISMSTERTIEVVIFTKMFMKI